jgi:putative ABC transport system permease protein
VNDLVIRLVEGADRDAAEVALENAVAGLPGVSATVSTRDDDRAYQLLYDDIEGDQKVWNVLSALVLVAASLAAFNLVGRIVEAQRREIGMQMALGVPPVRIAARPLMVGAQIALLGTVLGVVVGLLVGAGMRQLLVDFLPLPIWRTPFQPGVFAVAAGLGFVIPFVASALPVRRAVRVEPVEAIRTAHQPARGRGLVRLSHRVKIPGDSLAQLPLRNLLRSPRRTMLTAVGVGAAIAAMVGVVGMLDSFRATIQRGEDEIVQDHPDRVMVQLDGLVLADGPEVEALTASPLVGQADPSLELPATVRSPGDADQEPIDLVVMVADLTGAAWTPTVDDPAPATEGPGVVLARKAATDLGVDVGDAVIVRHPAQDAGGGLTQVDTQMTVVGLHPNPIRGLAFVDEADRDALAIPPVINRVDLIPAPGVGVDELRRAMFETPGVASAQPVTALTGVFDEALEQFLGFLVLTAGAHDDHPVHAIPLWAHRTRVTP